MRAPLHSNGTSARKIPGIENPGPRRQYSPGFPASTANPIEVSTGCPDLLAHALHEVLQAIENASARAGRPPARLLAVSKQQPAEAIRALASAGQAAFGENYVQEALAKQAELNDLALEWHLVGHLQSNKAAEAARAFDWVQGVDRLKLVEALARHRPDALAPLQVLIQVNIDDEASKHGCRPDEIDALADAIAAHERLRLRGLMAIPAARDDAEGSRPAFRAMKARFDALAARFAQVDTLSMGMSGDYGVAIEEGATLVRVGTALFGMRGLRAEG
jgi:PLP dependent protein